VISLSLIERRGIFKIFAPSGKTEQFSILRTPKNYESISDHY